MTRGKLRRAWQWWAVTADIILLLLSLLYLVSVAVTGIHGGRGTLVAYIIIGGLSLLFLPWDWKRARRKEIDR